MSIVKSENLFFEYEYMDESAEEVKKTHALIGVDIDIKQGEFVAIVGHNGSGKSTFAKHINAILRPTKGKIFVDGMDTADEKKLWNIRQEAGMVFQNPDNQIIGYSIEEDVAFALENIGVESKEMHKRVEDALIAVNMLDLREKSPNNLSGGQKQRVAIAGVLAMKPKCIVLDEPTAMLDPGGRAEVIRTVLELNKKEHVSIILITHYMEEAVDADRIIVMDDGKVAMSGTPKEVFSKTEELINLGLELPPVTKLAYELKKEGLDLEDGIITYDELVKGLKGLKR
ncbi:MAG: energy-coupling factor transporter ATPase [Lachnospiraceae bacterium]|nr:energy-coupling factor transporter ATPase [Lachnospiraceae bacterium]